MPTVLEAPETVQETTWQDDLNDQPIITSQPSQRHGYAGIRTWLHSARVAWNRHHADHVRQIREGSPRLERGVDILARENPFLHALSMVG